MNSNNPASSPESVARRYRELMPSRDLDSVVPNGHDGFVRKYTPAMHCMICPKGEGELCELNCLIERKNLEAADGIVVTVAQ